MAAADLGQQQGDLEKGQKYESLGFTWCKIGSIALIAVFPQAALLLASALAIYYYARAWSLGVDRSCCILRHPLIIIGFWTLVMAGDLVWIGWSLLARAAHP
jgi:hypothetical protein